MVEMAARDILPAVNAYTAEVAAGASAKTGFIATADVSMETELVETLSALVGKAYVTVKALKAADAAALKEKKGAEMATAFAERVIPLMGELRRQVDEMETMTSNEYWPMPNYGDMMFRI